MNLTTKNDRIDRLISMLLDHLIICFTILPPFTIACLIWGIEILSFNGISIGFWFISFLYFNKDFITAQSPAKRLIGFQVISRFSNQPATALQCFIRNLTIFLWPIEIIAVLIYPTRRIGDLLAHTAVERSDRQKLNTIWKDASELKLRSNWLLIPVIAMWYFYLLHAYILTV